MDNYPEVVAQIAQDYLDRMRAQLRLLPPAEREEFLREIESHVFEAYQQTPGQDGVARIFAVLRNLGEPAEVVADRLPDAMVRSGNRRKLPLVALGGIAVALFGIPLGFGGVAILVWFLVALAALVVAYYAAAGAALLASAAFLLLAYLRTYQGGMVDHLITLGVLKMDPDFADFVGQIAVPTQGFLLFVIGAAFAAAGVGMLWCGKYLLRGIRFLYGLVFEWARLGAQKVRRALARRAKSERLQWSEVA